MRIVKVEEEMEQIRFSERARYFALQQDMDAYSENDIAQGCFLALRVGVDKIA